MPESYRGHQAGHLARAGLASHEMGRSAGADQASYDGLARPAMGCQACYDGLARPAATSQHSPGEKQ